MHNQLPSHLQHAAFLVRWIVNVKMEVILSSETSVRIRYSQHHVQEYSNNHNHRCENLKSYMIHTIVPPKRRFLQGPHGVIPEDAILHIEYFVSRLINLVYPAELQFTLINTAINLINLVYIFKSTRNLPLLLKEQCSNITTITKPNVGGMIILRWILYR
jgi:hypothetical protein